MQLHGCTASSSICHHGKSDIWVWAAKGSLQLKPRSPRCNNVIKKDCWESFCFLTTQRFTDTKPWLMLGFARKECSWESRNFKLQLFFSVWNCLRSSFFKHEEKGTEICIMPPLSTPQKNINDLSEGGLGYVTNSDFLWMSQAKSWRKFSKNEWCTNFAKCLIHWWTYSNEVLVKSQWKVHINCTFKLNFNSTMSLVIKVQYIEPKLWRHVCAKNKELLLFNTHSAISSHLVPG